MPNNSFDTAGTPPPDTTAASYPVVRYDTLEHRRSVELALPVPPRTTGAEWTWPAAIAATCLVGMLGTILVYSTVDRLRTYTGELRSVRHRLADTRAELARRREEMTALADRIEQSANAASVLRDRAVAVRRTAQMEESREPEVSTIDVPVLPSGNLVQSDEAMRAFQGLVVLESGVTETVESVGLLTALLRGQERMSEAPAKAVLWPVRGRVTSEFGERSDPFNGDMRNHTGLDIDGEFGTPIVASADGEVAFAGRDAGYGNLIVVDHGGGVQTFYGHLSALYVREGQRIRGGLVIGAMGSTGRSTGTHCHFEVRVHGRPVNPRRFLANEPDLIPAAFTPPPAEAPLTKRQQARLIPVGANAIDRSRRADVSALVGP